MTLRTTVSNSPSAMSGDKRSPAKRLNTNMLMTKSTTSSAANAMTIAR